MRSLSQASTHGEIRDGKIHLTVKFVRHHLPPAEGSVRGEFTVETFPLQSVRCLPVVEVLRHERAVR